MVGCVTRERVVDRTLGSQPVGLMHVQLLDDGAAWIEGVRVHPGFRRRGVASALSVAGREYAIKKQSKVLRLATGMDNIASQSLFAGQGYACIAEYGEWLAEPARTESASVQLAMEHDLASVTSQWRNVSYTHIIQGPAWHWEMVNDELLAKFVRLGKVRAQPHGFAILRETGHSSLILHALVGDHDTMRKLALASLAEAGYRGMERAEAMLVDDDVVNRWSRRDSNAMVECSFTSKTSDEILRLCCLRHSFRALGVLFPTCTPNLDRDSSAKRAANRNRISHARGNRNRYGSRRAIPDS
jgi:hypothetical protein